VGEGLISRCGAILKNLGIGKDALDSLQTQLKELVTAQGKLAIGYLKEVGEDAASQGKTILKAVGSVTLEIAERIRNTIADYSVQLEDGQSLQVTVSIGVSIYKGGEQGPGSFESSEMLVDQADQALYQAKNSGKNRVISFGDNEMLFE